MTHRSHLIALSLLLTVAGCDEEAPVTDSGPGDDAGPGLDAGPGTDSGPGDAGTDAGPPLGERSSITLYLDAGPLTFDALDAEGNPLVLETGFGDTAGDVFFVDGDQLYRLDKVSRRLVDPIPLFVGDRSSTIEPEQMFGGIVGGSLLIAGLVGSDAYLWEPTPADAGAPRFAGPFPLTTSTGTGMPQSPFTPDAVGIISLDNVTYNLVAVFEDRFYLAEPGTVNFLDSTIAVSLCGTSGTLDPDFVFQGLMLGAPPTADQNALIVEDDRVYELGTGLCFEDGIQLVDDESSVIDAPTAAFSTNFDASADGSLEVLVVMETIND